MNINFMLLYWKPVVEIVILWFVIYHIMLFFEGTRAINVLKGIIVLVLAFLLIQVFKLDNLDWLMTKLLGISVLALLVIFHPEIRQGLARLGQRHIFGTALAEEELDPILKQIS
ncbi:MAG: TIGR00159 family protein, partial [Candidatus Omnitrophica bacterium]|nr:TIGR00159 family protein [Candidatus Omnitrophota bacterium]